MMTMALNPLLLASVTCAALFSLCVAPVWSQEDASDDTSARNTATSDAGKLRSVKLLDDSSGPRRLERHFFGQIVARETVDLSFEVAGRLIDYPVREGALLDQSSIVAGLDTQPLERALRRAELNLAQADRTRQRSQSLAADNATSQADADDASTAFDLAEVELADAREALDDATLRAPFDALVAARLTERFTNVTPGQPIVRLHDMSEVRVRVDVPEQLVQRYADPTAIEFVASSGNRFQDVPLELVEYQTQTGAIGQSYTVELLLPELDDMPLLPGASVTVTASVDAPTESRRLPASAVLIGAERDSAVMVFEPEDDTGDVGVLRRRTVSVESTSGQELVTRDLPPELTIVAAGVHLLEDGERVRRYRGVNGEDDR